MHWSWISQDCKRTFDSEHLISNVFTPSSPTPCFSQTDLSYLQVSILLFAFKAMLWNGQLELGLLPSIPLVPLLTTITMFSGWVHLTPTFSKFSMLSLNLFLDFNLLNDSTIENGLRYFQSPVITHKLIKNSDCPWTYSIVSSHNLPKDIINLLNTLWPRLHIYSWVHVTNQFPLDLLSHSDSQQLTPLEYSVHWFHPTNTTSLSWKCGSSSIIFF